MTASSFPYHSKVIITHEFFHNSQKMIGKGGIFAKISFFVDFKS